jgi:Helix-turn-helix domain
MGFLMSRLSWSAIEAGVVPRSTERLVLLDLADRARDAGPLRGVCWPTLGTIARRTGFNRRTVQRALDILAGVELVITIPNAQGHLKRGNAYRLNIARLEELASSPEQTADSELAVEPLINLKRVTGIGDSASSVKATRDTASLLQVTLTTFTGDSHDSLLKNLEGNQELEPNLGELRSRTPPVRRTGRAGRPEEPGLAKGRSIADHDVESIRLEYPRRVAPEPARKAIRAQHALLVQGKVRPAAGGTLPKMPALEATAFLLKQTRSFAASVEGTKDPKFIPYPATWFNAGRYTEDANTGGYNSALPLQANLLDRVRSQRGGE